MWLKPPGKAPTARLGQGVALLEVRVILEQAGHIEHDTVLGFLPGDAAGFEVRFRGTAHSLLQGLLELCFQLFGFGDALPDRWRQSAKVADRLRSSVKSRVWPSSAG